MLASASSAVGDVAKLVLERAARPFVVITAGPTAVGVIDGTELLAANPNGERGQASVRDIGRRDFIRVDETVSMYEVLRRMRAEDASVALVLPNETSPIQDVAGVITRRQLGDVLVDSTELFSE